MIDGHLSNNIITIKSNYQADISDDLLDFDFRP